MLTALRYPLNLVDGQQIVPLPGGPLEPLQIVLACAAYPGAGTVTVEIEPAGSGGVWLPLYRSVGLPLQSPVILNGYGGGRMRVTLAGIVGGSDLMAWIAKGVGQGFPDGAFVGLRALTVQPYTEANVKNGVQYYARAAWPLADPILAGTTRKLHFTTGAKPVLVKLREFQYIAEEIRIRLFRSPTGVSGGTQLTVHNYNGVSPVPTTVAGFKNVTTVTDGVEFDGNDEEFLFGSQSAPQRVAGSIPTGRERVLPMNASFLVSIQNTGSGDARCSYFLDWYEGGTDLPA